jgi:hypothetical protein
LIYRQRQPSRGEIGRGIQQRAMPHIIVRLCLTIFVGDASIEFLKSI